MTYELVLFRKTRAGNIATINVPLLSFSNMRTHTHARTHARTPVAAHMLIVRCKLFVPLMLVGNFLFSSPTSCLSVRVRGRAIERWSDRERDRARERERESERNRERENNRERARERRPKGNCGR